MQFELYNDSENVPEQRSSSAFQSTTLGLRSRLNQDLRPSSNVNTSVTTRPFGLQSRILSSDRNLKFGQDVDEVKRSMSVISRTSGMISEDLGLGAQNNERFHELRRNDCSVNRSYMSRHFGLQTRNLASFSHVVSEDNFRPNDHHSEVMNYRKNNNSISSMSRMFGLRSENLGGLNSHGNETLNHNIRKNNYVNSGLMLRSEGFSSRNLTVNSGLPSEGGLRLNEDSMYRNNGVSTSKSFRPIASSSSLGAGLHTQDSERYNDNIIDSGGFKRPLISKVIRGRNSTLSSRLFNSENIDRHCKDLSNINGFNVSHVSQRNVDTLSGSRFALSMRNNCADNQSISHSVSSVASVKYQVLNLLENVHYSVLKIGPHFTPEALRLVFEKAKQNVENLTEMSVANSIWNGDAASVISQSSKNMGPTDGQTMVQNTLDGGLLHLKSAKEVLQSLIMSTGNRGKNKTKNSSSVQKGGKGVVVRSSHREEVDDDSGSAVKEDENLSLVFRSPKSSPKKKKGPRVRAGGATRRAKSSTSKAKSKVINLKQWYPIAVGSDLAFCGVDDEGATVKTDAVKKRLNNRKVELVNGLACHLIGSPSAMVSVLPEKIMSLLKNGLTERWRVFQKELLNCQTAETNSQKRKSKSPKKVMSSPKKKTVKTPKAKVSKGRVQNQKITSTPVDEDGSGMQTRSGRTIKPPKMFWLVPITENDEVTSSSAQEKEESSSKKSIKYIHETPVKNFKEVARETSRWKVKASRVASPGKRKKSVEESSPKRIRTKPSEAKGNKKKEEREEEVVVDSFTEYTKRQSKSPQTSSKRKREVTEDADAVLPKKSKLGKKAEVEISETSAKGKKEKSGPSPRKKSPKLKGWKPSPTKKKKAPAKKKMTVNASESKKEKKERKDTKEAKVTKGKKERKDTKEKKERKDAKEAKVTKETKEMREMSMCEDDFELNLEDIEIPEIGNVSRNPHLNRSQLRLESMETPPLKYFTNNLKILGSVTPVQSPDWCITQRTESEVKQFQKRREKAFKKKMKVDIKNTVITEKSSKSFQNRDVKRVMEWVSEKTVKSPQWTSKVLQYIIPSRKRMEQQADEEEDEDIESEFL